MNDSTGPGSSGPARGSSAAPHASGARADDPAPPLWWVLASALTVALAAGLWLWNQALHVDPGPLERYLAERAAALDTGEPVTDDTLVALTRDKLAVQAGAAAFARTCVKCHGERGEGNIGPNLTDPFWIGGGAPVDIYQTILLGRDGKGMPSWGLQLGTGACKQITAFVLSIRDENLAGKAPQGQRWPR
jgi:cytochrome c oxidase cbb3-type subunit III